MKKILLSVGALAAVIALSSSCSKTPTRDDIVKEMKDQGIPDNMVDCVTDKMISQFGLEKLGSNDDLTAEEKAAATKIGEDCAMQSLGVTTTVA